MKDFRSIIRRLFIFSFIIVGFFIISSNNSFADTFYKNEIKVKINKDGSADIESIMDFLPTK